MNNNIAVKYFHQQLIKLVNNCGLSVGAAYFVMKDVLNELEKMFNEYAYKESQQDNQSSETQTLNVPDPMEFSKEEEKENKYEQQFTNTTEYSAGNDDN